MMLLKLCFDRIMEDQHTYWQLKCGSAISMKKLVEIMPKRSDGLGGNRIAPPERWRQEMLRKVIRPLNRCREYLSYTNA